jgi:hypothetical protein
VLHIAAIPESYREAAQALLVTSAWLLGDYVAYAMELTEWNIKVEFALEASAAPRPKETTLELPLPTDVEGVEVTPAGRVFPPAE